MSQRDVNLKIKVDDTEVVASTESVKRLKTAANDVGKTTGPAELENNLKKSAGFVEQFVTGVQKGFKAAGYEVTYAQAAVVTASVAIVGSILLIVAAAGALVGVTYKVSEAVYDVSKSFAAAGMEAGKYADANGLALASSEALRHEADRTGTSFESVEAAANSLRKTIGEAMAGNDVARGKLKLLGIDAKTAASDIDGAFKQAIRTIVSLPPGIEQARAAFAAFGEDGYKLIPFFQSFHGNVDEAIKRAREFGIELGGKDVAAGRDFTKTLEDAKAAVTGLERAFGREFLPTVTGVIKDFTGWLKTNKTTINDWATSTGNAVKGVIAGLREVVQFVKDHPYLVRGALAVATIGQSEGAYAAFGGLATVGANQPGASQLPGQFTTDYSRPQDAKPDMATLEAARAEMEKREKEAIERAKKDWEAAIQSWELYGTQAEKTLGDTYKALRDQFDQTGDSKAFISNVTASLQQYVNATAKAMEQLDKLENEKAARDKATDNELTVLHQQQVLRRTRFDEIGQKVAKDGNDAVKAATKKDNAEYLGELESRIRREIELYDERDQTDMVRRNTSLAQGLITDQQYLDRVKKTELDALEFRRGKLEELLKATGDNAKKRADIEGQISVIGEQITRQKLENEQRLTPMLEAQRDIQREINRLKREDADLATTEARRRLVASGEELDLMVQRRQLQDASANSGINDGLIVEVEHLRDILEYRNRELDAVISINRSQMELDHAMDVSNTQIRAGILDHMAQQKTLQQGIIDGWNKTYDAILGVVNGPLDALDKKTKGFLSFLIEPAKAIQGQLLNKIFEPIVDSIFGPGTSQQTNNPVAKPIVDKLNTTNQILNAMLVKMGGAPVGTGTMGGGLSSIFGSIFGSGGTGIFGGQGSNPNVMHATGGSSSGGSGSAMDDLLGQLRGGVGSSQGGGTIFDSLKKIFSTGEGGLFAPKKNLLTGEDSKLGGIMSGAGGLMGILGGLIGGNAGGVLSSVGTFMSLGANFGPIGAGVGAAVGLIVGLFGISSKRKKEEQTRNAGLLDAEAAVRSAFDSAKQDLQFGRTDGPGALSSFSSSTSQIMGQYMQMANSLTDKKTRSHAIQDASRVQGLIATKTDELKALAAMAEANAERSKRIIPEFAGGHYFADYFRPNGLLPGMFDGRDDLLAMISRGEMVLNPQQQNRVRQLAGHDVFAGAGIPNYPRSNPSAKLAMGGIASGSLALAGAPNIVVQPRFTLELSGVSLDDKVEAYLTSDTGIRTQIQVNKTLKKRGDI